MTRSLTTSARLEDVSPQRARTGTNINSVQIIRRDCPACGGMQETHFAENARNDGGRENPPPDCRHETLPAVDRRNCRIGGCVIR